MLKCRKSENQGIQLCDIFANKKNVKEFLIKHYPEITQNLHFQPVDDESERFFRVIHIASCADFFIQDVEDDEIVQAISDILTLDEEARTLTRGEVRVGDLAAAQYSDSKWFVFFLISKASQIQSNFIIFNVLRYRVKVSKLVGNEAEYSFIDFGNHDKGPVTNLRKLPADPMMELSPKAKNVCLQKHYIETEEEPHLTYHETDMEFYKLTRNKVFNVHYYVKNKDCDVIDLYDPETKLNVLSKFTMHAINQ